MGIINNAVSPLIAQYSQLADNIAGLGKAVNNPEAALARAQKEKILNDIEIANKSFGLEEAQQPYKLDLLKAQTGAHGAIENKYNSEAEYDRARRGKVEQETLQLTEGWNARKQIGPRVAAAYNLTPSVGAAIDALALGSGDSNSQQLGNMVAKLGRLDPIEVNAGNSIAFHPSDDRLPSNQRPALETAQDPLQPTGQWQGFPYMLPGQAPVPFQQPQQDVSVGRVGLGDAVNPRAQANGLIVNGNIVTFPGKDTPKIGANPYVPTPALDTKAERPAVSKWMSEDSMGKAAKLTQTMDQMEALLNSQNKPYQGPLGSVIGSMNFWNPNAQQFNQVAQLAAAASRTEPGAVSNYEQQIFQKRVPNLNNSEEANRAMVMMGKATAKKMAETENFVQRFMSQGGSFAQAMRIQNEYEMDARSRSFEELPNGGVRLKPNISIFDWYKEKLENPGTPLGGYEGSQSAPAPTDNFVVGRKYSSNGITKTYKGNGVWE